jgi:hypothetical protein
MSDTLERYREVNGTSYDARTPDAVVRALENARLNNWRVRVFYGDAETGRAWPEENDVAGTVGRSTGRVKIPLLIANSRSHGGPGLLDRCVVAIATAAGRFIYQHGGFDVGKWELLRSEWAEDPRPYLVHHDGQAHAAFTNEPAALRYVQFMRGGRMAK